MINSYKAVLIELAKDNSEIIFLIIDDGELYKVLSDAFPDRTINVGIAECNAISVAAGLASCGKIPIVTGGNSFMAYRSYEFIRDQLCMQNRNVKVVGIGAGMAISFLGNTQHATEDLGALRALPNLMIMTPATPTEVRHVVGAALEVEGPVFIRIGRSCGVDFYREDVKFEPFKMQRIKKGSDLTIFATGSIVCDALWASEELAQKGFNIGVVNVHTLKPLDSETLKIIYKESKRWLSLEEHNLCGGLGGALAEAIIDEALGVKMKRMGLNDHFPIGHGNYEDIKKVNKLGREDIISECLAMVT